MDNKGFDVEDEIEEEEPNNLFTYGRSDISGLSKEDLKELKEDHERRRKERIDKYMSPPKRKHESLLVKMFENSFHK